MAHWRGKATYRDGGFCTNTHRATSIAAAENWTHPEKRWGDLVSGMTDEQMAVMRGPDRDVFEKNVPRLEIADGSVVASYERGSTLYSKEAPTGPVVKK